MSAAPAKDKKQIVVVSIFGVLLVVFVAYAYNSFFGGAPNPAATPAPVSESAVARSSSSRAETESAGPVSNTRGQTTAPGIAAKRMASTSASLDPTLDESAMLRTESLVYAGTGRNIFSAISAPPPMVIPKNVPNARPGAAGAAAGPPVPTGPPPPPPINLKFFGIAVRLNGRRQAFLLDGEDVYLASEGDIVARKYRIVSISANSIRVEDLVNNDTQVLPLIGGGNLDLGVPRMHSSVEAVPPSPVDNTPPSRPVGDLSNNPPANMPNRPARGGFRGSFQNPAQN